MTLQQLVYAVKIADTKSMNKAAAELYVSQPALSSTIRDLEEELNIELFIRTNRGIVITAEGDEFLSYARQMVELNQMIEDRYVNNEKKKNKFSVSMQHYSFAVEAFIELAKEIRLDDFELAVHETRTNEVIEFVRDYRSELGILYLNEFNRKALQKLSYGVYLVTTSYNGKPYGCVANSAMQITSAPAQIAVSINHDNATHDQIAQSGKFALAILATDTDPALIGGFGYRSSRDADKFAGVSCTEQDGMPVPDGAMAWIACRVVKLMDAGTHTIFLGEVTDCDLNREDGIPMTYQFYHSVIKGASPKNAPTYISPED